MLGAFRRGGSLSACDCPVRAEAQGSRVRPGLHSSSFRCPQAFEKRQLDHQTLQGPRGISGPVSVGAGRPHVGAWLSCTRYLHLCLSEKSCDLFFVFFFFFPKTGRPSGGRDRVSLATRRGCVQGLWAPLLAGAPPQGLQLCSSVSTFSGPTDFPSCFAKDMLRQGRPPPASQSWEEERRS